MRMLPSEQRKHSPNATVMCSKGTVRSGILAILPAAVKKVATSHLSSYQLRGAVLAPLAFGDLTATSFPCLAAKNAPAAL